MNAHAAAFAAAPAARLSPRVDRPLVRGRITIRPAAVHGLCPGVRRALRLAVEARRAVSGRVVLTGPLVHNPHVLAALAEMGIEPAGGGPPPGPGDAAVLPAFGLPPEEMLRWSATGARLVDTTCGSVRSVWRDVVRLSREGFTVVYHGEPGHEETLATLARVDGPWCVVRDEAEAAGLARRIADPGEAAGRAPFPFPASPGFDAARDLSRVGLAHQTTMPASDSRRIAARLREATEARAPGGDSAERFRGPATLCPATQARQDAAETLAAEGVDLVVVVGGRASNNTRSLAAAAGRRVPAYHVEDPEDIPGPDRIRSWSPAAGPGEDERAGRILTGWLPAGPVLVGLTAGASTPDAVTESVAERILSLGGALPVSLH
jgi:4-hydroxy-3-methylbut-2-enyl diphosphate reductase